MTVAASCEYNPMNAMTVTGFRYDHVMHAAITACKRISQPVLSRQYLGPGTHIDLAPLEFSEAAAVFADVSGARMTMPRAWYAQLIKDGTVTDDDIAAALKESLSDQIEWLTVQDIKQHAHAPELPRQQLPVIADLARVDGVDDLPAFVAEQIAQWSALHATRAHGSRRLTEHGTSLYASWRHDTCCDDTAASVGLAGINSVVATFPATAGGLLDTAVNQLGLHLPGLANWFHRQLASIHADASCADYLWRQPEQHSAAQKALLDLLAIRVAWDLALFRILRDSSSLESVWTVARNSLLGSTQQQQMLAMDCVLQNAYEKSWQRNFIHQLQAKPAVAGSVGNAAKATTSLNGSKARNCADKGLAGLAAFIVAPHALTRAVASNDKVCRHSYDWQHDSGYTILEKIMTVPLLAASCRNLQYYRTTVHSSVATSGPGQQPVRLSVLLAAPVLAIDKIIARHPRLRDLVNNGWIHVFAVAPSGKQFFHRFAMDGWARLPGGPTTAEH